MTRTHLETWQEALNRRHRTMLRMLPFERLESTKALRGDDLTDHDLRAMALRTMDLVIEAMGLGYGATHVEVVDALAPLVRAAEPQASEQRVAVVARVVLDGLLNERDRRQAFREEYGWFEDERMTRRVLSFHLLRERQRPDGSIILVATTEGINVYAGMLDYEVEDAQAAEEAILQAQVKRGRIDAAVATAKRARIRSIEYEQKLLGVLDTVRRDVAQVDWVQDVLSTLADARAHLEEREHVERQIVDALEARFLDETDGPQALQLRDLITTLEECLQRHLRLLRRLITANGQYLAEQERQVFRPRALSALPDLEADVLMPAMKLPTHRVAALAEPMLAMLQAPVRPRPMVLDLLVNALLAPRREVIEPPPLEGPQLERVPFQEFRFPEQLRVSINALLVAADSGERLSGLLATAREQGADLLGLQYLVLRVLQAFDDDDEASPDLFRSVDAGTPLTDASFTGRDLAVIKQAAP